MHGQGGNLSVIQPVLDFQITQASKIAIVVLFCHINVPKAELDKLRLLGNATYTAK